MAVKQIVLRGISRTPSDRMNSDGGVAESLNFQIEEQESAPIKEADDVSSRYNFHGANGEIVYVHKSNSYENLICWNKRSGEIGAYIDGHYQVIENVGGKQVDDVCALGNTLVISRGGQMSYVLYRNHKYIYLGNSIPFPEIEIRAEAWEPEQGGPERFPLRYTEDIWNTVSVLPSVWQLNANVWNAAKSTEYDTVSALYSSRMEARRIAEKIKTALIGQMQGVGMYACPVFVRYAICLYDGSEIASDPIYVSAAENQVFAENINIIVRYLSYTSGTYHWEAAVSASGNPFDIVYRKKDTAIHDLVENWSDIVKSIRFYVSQDLQPDSEDTVTGVSITDRSESQESGMMRVSGKIVYGEEHPSENTMLNSGVMNLVEEISIDALNRTTKPKTLPYLSNTDRALKQTFKVSTIESRHSYICKSMMNFNNRLVMSDCTVEYTRGMSYPHARLIGNRTGSLSSDIQKIKAIYILRNQYGDDCCIHKVIYDRNDTQYFGDPVSYFYYPSIHCEMVILHVFRDAYDMACQLKLSPHPQLPGNYFYSKEYFRLDDLITAIYQEFNIPGATKIEDDPYIEPEESRTMFFGNRLYITEPSNFYIMRQSVDFSARVKEVGIATRALSEGQFGQYPLLAYTDDGIWAMDVDPEGTLVSKHPLSREIIKGHHTPLDQAAVFVSDKGVMLISGSDVVSLSEHMKGKHYKLDEQCADMLSATAFGDLLNTLKDVTPFNSFVNKSEAIFDSAGNRLIFFATDEEYAYVLRLDTSTWHKLTIPKGFSFSNILNSYPKALVAMKSKEVGKFVFFDEYDPARLEDARDYLRYTFPGNKGEELAEALRDRASVDMSEYSDNEIRRKVVNSLTYKYNCQVRKEDFQTTKIFDYSTILTDSDLYEPTASSVTGCIITRTIDLDNPDVLKTINHLKIRGRYERYYIDSCKYWLIADWKEQYTSPDWKEELEEIVVPGCLSPIGATMTTEQIHSLVYEGRCEVSNDFPFDMFKEIIQNFATMTLEDVLKPRVSYILLGSQDGIHFARLGSLRGKSWKMFRIIILAKLRPHERISWIDIDYETRFTNKLR